jgi:hypothetical protein
MSQMTPVNICHQFSFTSFLISSHLPAAVVRTKVHELWATNVVTVATNIRGWSVMARASCHLSDAGNFEMGYRFAENLPIPILEKQN